MGGLLETLNKVRSRILSTLNNKPTYRVNIKRLTPELTSTVEHNDATRIDPQYLMRRRLTPEESEYETRKNNVLGNLFTAPFNKESAQYLLEGLGEGMQTITPEFLREPLAKVGTYISPLNYIAAISLGSLDPELGEKIASLWDPRFRLGEIFFGPKVVKGAVSKATPYVKSATASTVNTVRLVPIALNNLQRNLKDYRIFGRYGLNLRDAVKSVGRDFESYNSLSNRLEGHYYYQGLNDLNEVNAASRFGGLNTFISYGRPWEETAGRRVLLEIPAELLGKLPLTDMFGRQTGYDVLSIYRQMTGAEKQTAPVQLLRDIQKGGNLTVVLAERLKDLLQNGTYNFYITPYNDVFMPFGAKGRSFNTGVRTTNTLPTTSLRFFERTLL